MPGLLKALGTVFGPTRHTENVVPASKNGNKPGGLSATRFAAAP